MKTILRWLALVLGVVSIIVVAFSLYSRFLVDVSLESLQMAGRVAERSQALSSETSLHVYRNLMQSLMFEEAARSNGDVKNLVMLEMASRSASGQGQGDFQSRYKFYLSEVSQEKISQRSWLLRGLDSVARSVAGFKNSAQAMLGYVSRRGVGPEKKAPVKDLTSAVLLSQAETSEKKGELGRAVELYTKYLERNPLGADSGYVAISLAHVYLKQKKWQEARSLLNRVQADFAGGDEVTIAQTLERRIDTMKKQFDQITALQTALEKSRDAVQKENIRYDLGLKLLAAADLKGAKEQFQVLETAQQPDRRTRARFYLGWIFKLENQYEVSAKILQLLAGEAGIDEGLKKGALAELADIRYQQGDEKASLENYRKISPEGCGEGEAKDISRRAWTGLAELEQSYIYFSRGDGVQAGQKIGCLVKALGAGSSLGGLQIYTKGGKAVDMQTSAFDSLRQGRIEQAADLFTRGIQQSPEDYRGYSGMAMVHILRAELPEAEKEALRGYQLKTTEYSASVMGYLAAFRNDPDKAIAFYLQALEKNPNYVPGRFNLACLYLKKRDYREALKHLLELERGINGIGGVLASKVLNNLGCALWWLGKEEDAIKRFKAAISITPGFVDAELNLKQVALNKVPQAATVPQILNVER